MLSVKQIINSIVDKADRKRAEKIYSEHKQYFKTIFKENNDLSEDEIIEILIDELTDISVVELYESKN